MNKTKQTKTHTRTHTRTLEIETKLILSVIQQWCFLFRYFDPSIEVCHFRLLGRGVHHPGWYASTSHNLGGICQEQSVRCETLAIAE